MSQICLRHSLYRILPARPGRVSVNPSRTRSLTRHTDPRDARCSALPWVPSIATVHCDVAEAGALARMVGRGRRGRGLPLPKPPWLRPLAPACTSLTFTLHHRICHVPLSTLPIGCFQPQFLATAESFRDQAHSRFVLRCPRHLDSSCCSLSKRVGRCRGTCATCMLPPLRKFNAREKLCAQSPCVCGLRSVRPL